MKRIISIFIAITAVALATISCSKDETYPSHLVGTWSYANGSTGYTGSLVIEDIDGGQLATFELKSPSGNDYFQTKNSFTYDSATGEGNIRSTMMGGKNVMVQAYKGNDKMLDITITQLVSGGNDTTFTGTFTK